MVVAVRTMNRLDPMQTQTRQSYAEVRALERGLDILECLSVSGWLKPAEIAAKTGLDRASVYLSFWVEINMKMIAAELPIEQFDAADFDDPVTLGRVKSGRFGIENDLTNHRCALCC